MGGTAEHVCVFELVIIYVKLYTTFSNIEIYTWFHLLKKIISSFSQFWNSENLCEVQDDN